MTKNWTKRCCARWQKLCDDHTIRRITQANQKSDVSIIRMEYTSAPTHAALQSTSPHPLWQKGTRTRGPLHGAPSYEPTVAVTPARTQGHTHPTPYPQASTHSSREPNTSLQPSTENTKSESNQFDFLIKDRKISRVLNATSIIMLSQCWSHS